MGSEDAQRSPRREDPAQWMMRDSQRRDLIAVRRVPSTVAWLWWTFVAIVVIALVGMLLFLAAASQMYQG